jgi:hypothetical protein
VGFRVWGSGIRVQNLGFRVQDSGCRAKRLEVATEAVRDRTRDRQAGGRVPLGFRVQGLGFTVYGLGFRV